MEKLASVGIVVIGRNEGERLKRCIQSVIGKVSTLVYVDSGSTDGSVEWASEQGVEVETLDTRQPFTAARARNQGFSRLMVIAPDTEYVQFIDGDCEVDNDWMGEALRFFHERKDVAVVCGRRREKYPEASIYNRLCDIEWDTPIGQAKACGGDAMIRADILQLLGGYRPDVIAGEEPELCFRIRDKGGKILRIDAEMTLHDAQMTRFGQWWNRAKRCGYAYALGASIHGRSAERYRVKEVLRVLVWGLFLPLTIVGLAFISPLFMGLFAVYAFQYFRLVASASSLDTSVKKQWALFNVLGKFPELLGVLKFGVDCLLGRRAKIIEYK